MIRCDYHIHTNFSSDADSTMEEYILKAIEYNLDELCFTEHLDINECLPKNYGEWVDLDKFLLEFTPLKEKYKDLISIKFGVEVGFRVDIEDKIKSMLDKYDFDFILGSSHVVDMIDIGFTPHLYFEKYSLEEGYRLYLEEIYKNIMVFEGYYDVYAHIDYIVRYGGANPKYLDYNAYTGLIDKIFIELIKRGKGIEVNASGFKYGLGTPHPNYEILKRYKDLGGTIITVGSDAHHTNELCANFDIIEAKLKEIGFEHITIYEHRNPKFIKL